MVMDFNPDEDVVGLAGVSFYNLAFEQVGRDTRLSVNGSREGLFKDVDTSIRRSCLISVILQGF